MKNNNKPMTCGDLMSEDMEPDIDECSICGKRCHADDMLISGHKESDDYVCSETCADDWNERQSEAMFG